jgi:hypothetical protein
MTSISGVSKIIKKTTKVYIFVNIIYFKEYGKIIINIVVMKLLNLDIILVNL